MSKKGKVFFNLKALSLFLLFFLVIFTFYQMYEIDQRKIFLQKELQQKYNIDESQYKIDTNRTYLDYGYILTFNDEREVKYFFVVFNKDSHYTLYSSSYRFENQQDNKNQKTPKRAEILKKINEKLE